MSCVGSVRCGVFSCSVAHNGVDILRSGWELLFNVLIYNWFGALCERGRAVSSVLCMCVL